VCVGVEIFLLWERMRFGFFLYCENQQQHGRIGERVCFGMLECVEKFWLIKDKGELVKNPGDI
jgi:hypothetical protein